MQTNADIFDNDRYYAMAFQPWKTDFERKKQRGFITLTAFLMDLYYNKSSVCDNFLEFGIGGGGTHAAWRKCLDPEIEIYGMDRWYLDYKKLGNSYAKHHADYENAQQLLEEESSLKFFHGLDAYNPKHVKAVVEQNNNEPFGVVIDDGDPDNGALNGLMTAWQGNVSGWVISETPFGNGIEGVYNLPLEEKWLKLEKLSREQNMVIFDCSKFASDYPNTRMGKIDYPLPYMAVWGTPHMWDKFKRHKWSKIFDDCVMYGQEIINGENNG